VQVVQIVKRFGPVGGMEEYVFKLSIELTNLGCEVTVLCEESFSENTSEVKVYEFGPSAKLRWFSHYQFSQKVSKWLSENNDKTRIIHSHERQSSHHVTTFHTTPFGHGRGPLFRFLSLRNFLYEQLERRELKGRDLQVIVPVSNRLGEMMLAKHHWIKERISDAIYPAVSITSENPTRNHVPPDGGTIGFIGKEWQRKGLTKVVQIWRDLKEIRPKLRLKVAGPPMEDIQSLFSSCEKDYDLLGYVDDKPKFFESIDVLVHPAKLEAFGMVITEALSFGVPVLCSSECGAAEVISERYKSSALSHQSKNEFWLNELESIFSNKKSMEIYTRTWEQVALEYLSVYRSISGRI
jgi:UDP-glucose:(heptosyl)LPS alpha-1,3-glucosyltransferase